MHVPDGFLDAPTSVGTAAVAVVGVAVAMALLFVGLLNQSFLLIAGF